MYALLVHSNVRLPIAVLATLTVLAALPRVPCEAARTLVNNLVRCRVYSFNALALPCVTLCCYLPTVPVLCNIGYALLTRVSREAGGAGTDDFLVDDIARGACIAIVRYLDVCAPIDINALVILRICYGSVTRLEGLPFAAHAEFDILSVGVFRPSLRCC